MMTKISILSKDYKTGVDFYNKIEKEAIEMADAISDAVIKQFPQMFLK
jgi:hypothetical protein